MSRLTEIVQQPSPGERVELFRFDATSVGGGILFFVQGSKEATEIKFGGQAYTPADVEFTDLETNGTGTLPTPHIKIGNANGVFQSIVNSIGDLLGCTLHRVRTFRRFLDGESEADPTAYYGPDVFLVERKVDENPVFIEWELSASIDQAGKMLPGRVVIRDTCLWRYRRWDEASGTFDYAKAQCPYTGTNYFDHLDQPTTDPAKDKPSRRLSCCEKRFGVGNPLPFGGFPGVARIRQ